jgi:hypothetical protein
MVVNIWTQCTGKKHIQLIHETGWRIVESQEMTATRKLVDSFEEESILEDMIESNKPPVPKKYLHYHPLLYTPFRYPPLKYGSRFGKKSEPSLWYGSLELNTAFAEKAFYLFHFINASDAELGIIAPQFTAFSAQIKSEKGVKLNAVPFVKYKKIISATDHYHESQALGSAMRAAGVETFTYQSARVQDKGINIALFTANAFLHKKPDARSFQSWQCIAGSQLIEFRQFSASERNTMSFSIKQFMDDGVLPFPAN